jgi:hypothetical protein
MIRALIAAGTLDIPVTDPQELLKPPRPSGVKLSTWISTLCLSLPALKKHPQIIYKEITRLPRFQVFYDSS